MPLSASQWYLRPDPATLRKHVSTILARIPWMAFAQHVLVGEAKLLQQLCFLHLQPWGAHGYEGCSGRTLAWRSQAKIFHYPSTQCLRSQPAACVEARAGYIVIHAHMECRTQEACLNGNGSGDVCKHKTNVHVGHTCLGHLHITIYTLLYLSRHEPFDHAWHKLRARGNQPEHSATACAHAMDQLHQLELHMRMLQQAALAACND